MVLGTGGSGAVRLCTGGRTVGERVTFAQGESVECRGQVTVRGRMSCEVGEGGREGTGIKEGMAEDDEIGIAEGPVRPYYFVVLDGELGEGTAAVRVIFAIRHGGRRAQDSALAPRRDG